MKTGSAKSEYLVPPFKKKSVNLTAIALWTEILRMHRFIKVSGPGLSFEVSGPGLSLEVSGPGLSCSGMAEVSLFAGNQFLFAGMIFWPFAVQTLDLFDSSSWRPLVSICTRQLNTVITRWTVIL